MKKYLSIAEASEYCGVSKRLLYKIVSNREIRSFRIHTKIVLAVEDLERFIGDGIVEEINWDERARELNK